MEAITEALARRGLTPTLERLTDLAVDVGAVARLTRLVTTDEITRPIRDAAIRAVFARAGRAAELEELAEWDTSPSHAVEVVKDPPKLAILVTCPWCSSFWIGLGVMAARTWLPGPWRFVGRALALSEAAGKLRG